jgi:NADH-quinone oxidoreductase subunit G
MLNVRREARSGGQVVIKRVMPRQNEQVNEIWLCDKGRWVHHYASAPDRLTTPLVREGGALRPATWDEALARAADGLKAAGAGTRALLGGRLANEDLFNIQQVVNALGGQAVQASHMDGGELTKAVGVGVGTNFGDMGRGTAILVVASDLEHEAPIWYLRVKQAADRGATLIVANARPTQLDTWATHVVRYDYGHAVAAVLGMLVAGSSEAAEAFARAENAVVLFGREGLDFAGTGALAQASANLLIATGHFGRPHNGLVGVWPAANTQGAWELGIAARDLAQGLAGAQALWIAGDDPVGDGALTAEAVRAAGFVVVHELFRTATAEAADVVLPANSWAEREGTFTSGERRVQRLYPTVTPKGRPDCVLAAEIGQRLGVALKTSPAAVMLEIARAVPAFVNLTYQKLAETEPQWPDVGGRDMYYGGTSYENGQGLGVKLPTGAELGQGPATGKVAQPHSPERAADAWLVVPITRIYDRDNVTARSHGLIKRIESNWAALNPADAERLGVAKGDTLTLSAAGREASLVARIDPALPPGVVLVPRHSAAGAVPPWPTHARLARAAVQPVTLAVPA